MNRKVVRPVVIASICGPVGDANEFMRLTREAAAQHPDIIVLPENWQNTPGETLSSPIIAELQTIARESRAYILHATYLIDGGATYNTALFIGRDGAIAGRYDKIYPYWAEFPAIAPGRFNQPIIDCDFGKVAILICFDANFPELWANAAAQGAEIVLWASAYGAGRQLQAHALNHHFYIVTSTLSGNAMAFDINGERIIDAHGDGHFTQWVTLDLDRCIFHENFNEDKLQTLLNESPRRVEIEGHRMEEQWIIVRSAQGGVSARVTCQNAGMEELRAYKARSRREIDVMRL